MLCRQSGSCGFLSGNHIYIVVFMKIKRIHILLALLAVAICAIPFRAKLRRPIVAVIQILRGKKTVTDRVKQFGDAVRERLASDFERIGFSYPSKRMILVGLKQENLLELWVSENHADPKLLKSYPILGASGTLGPKLKEGDMQVPEGVYRIESLNPNSMYHLALRVDYPNQFDKAKGKVECRENLGCDIMIHGKDCSIGCLAIGDEAAEELFVLAAEIGIDNISVILSPVDFRTSTLPESMPTVPDWTPELYDSIRKELKKLKKTTRHSNTTSLAVRVPQNDSERLLQGGGQVFVPATLPRAGNLSRELKRSQNQKRLCASGLDRPGGCIHAGRGVVHQQ